MFPRFQVAHVLFRTGGKGDGVVGEAEGIQKLESQLQHAAYLFLHLLRAAEYVGVVLGEAAHPHKAVQYTAALVAVDGA